MVCLVCDLCLIAAVLRSHTSRVVVTFSHVYVSKEDWTVHDVYRLSPASWYTLISNITTLPFSRKFAKDIYKPYYTWMYKLY